MKYFKGLANMLRTKLAFVLRKVEMVIEITHI
jgi:hypothetical protein